MPGLPEIELLELPLICLGELNAPKSCWNVVGMRQRSAAGRSLPLLLRKAATATGDPVVLPFI